MGKLALLEKGIRNPWKVPPFVLEKLFPNSRWGPDWRRENGFVTFDPGGFAAGSADRPAFAARLHRESRAIDRVLGDRRVDRSLEIGSGYGRLSGWVADHAESAVAVEPNASANRRAAALHPDVGFGTGLAGRLPFADDSFDLLVSWMVLTHVPPEEFEAAVADLVRVSRPGATAVLLERTDGRPGRVSWPRSHGEYEAVFAPFEVVDVADRPTEPTFDGGDHKELLVLER